MISRRTTLQRPKNVILLVFVWGFGWVCFCFVCISMRPAPSRLLYPFVFLMIWKQEFRQFFNFFRRKTERIWPWLVYSIELFNALMLLAFVAFYGFISNEVMCTLLANHSHDLKPWLKGIKHWLHVWLKSLLYLYRTSGPIFEWGDVAICWRIIQGLGCWRYWSLLYHRSVDLFGGISDINVILYLNLQRGDATYLSPKLSVDDRGNLVGLLSLIMMGVHCLYLCLTVLLNKSFSYHSMAVVFCVS